ncbi:MAG: murein hydrolase activator EnvC family protein [Bacteroidales bacterium]
MENEEGGRRFVLRLLLFIMVAAVAAAQSASPPQQDRITALHAEAESLARQERTLLNELRQLEVARALRAEELRQTTEQLADLTRQRDETAARRAALETQVATDRPALAARLAQLYKLGPAGYARLLLDVEGVRSAARAYRTVSVLAESDRRRAAQFREAVDGLRAAERTLADRTARVAALQQQAQAAKSAADQAVTAHTALIARIDARRDLNARLAGEVLAAQQKLSSLVPTSTPTAPAAAPAPPFAALRGTLDWPASGRLTARFGPQRDPLSGATALRAGVDIGAAAGDQAHAIEDGIVTYAEPFTGFGNLVIVDHAGAVYSLYGYLDQVAVRRGARVTRGEAVGTVGHDPGGKPGLYFELRIDGKAVDPVQWLKKR